MQAPPGPRRTSFVLKVQPPWSDALNSQPHRELLPWFAAQVSVCGEDCECHLRRMSRRPGPDSPLTPLFPGCTEASSVLETEQRRAWHLSRAGIGPLPGCPAPSATASARSSALGWVALRLRPASLDTRSASQMPSTPGRLSMRDTEPRTSAVTWREQGPRDFPG